MADIVEMPSKDWGKKIIAHINEELHKATCKTKDCLSTTLVVGWIGGHNDQMPPEMKYSVRFDCAGCGYEGRFTLGMTEEQLKQSPFIRGMMIGDIQKVVRPDVPEDCIVVAIQLLGEALGKRLIEKGSGSFSSNHEAMAVIMEELSEYQGEIHRNNEDGERKELMDVCVASIFGIACQLAGTMDRR